MAKQVNSAPNEVNNDKIISTTIQDDKIFNQQIKKYLKDNLKLKLTYGTNGNFLNAYIELEGELIQAEWLDDSKFII